ncbi:hypothetical protein E2C01_046243 [Portunus trituberculatus]|uniref:Uncharacterized protein n=1 Tax=Portunus trituberculatus TaxID=210409 RepID=A0A5B7G4J2_PORTR|nr:hypothetical protein [Portunus trituberculatus]
MKTNSSWSQSSVSQEVLAPRELCLSSSRRRYGLNPTVVFLAHVQSYPAGKKHRNSPLPIIHNHHLPIISPLPIPSPHHHHSHVLFQATLIYPSTTPLIYPLSGSPLYPSGLPLKTTPRLTQPEGSLSPQHRK